MNFDIEKMFSGNEIVGYVGLGILGYFLLGALFEMLFGLKRGWRRQVVHIIFSAVAIVGAFLLTKMAQSSALSSFEESTVGELVSTIEGYGVTIEDEVREIVLAFDPKLLSLVFALPMATIISPLLFTLFFIAINLILKLICFIVNRFIGRARGKLDRLIGMLVGLLEGAVVAALVLLPAAAYSDLAIGVGEAITSEAISSNENISTSELDAVLDEYIEPIAANPALSFTKLLGGDAIIKSFAQFELGGSTVDMREQLYGAAKIAAHSEAFGAINWEHLSEEDKASVDELVNAIVGSEYYSELFVGIFKTAANLSAESGDPVISNTASGELVAELFSDVSSILGTSTADTVREDLNTIKELFFVLSDTDVIKAFNGGVSTEIMIGVLNTKYDDEHTVLEKTISVIRSTERTKPIIVTLTKLSISIMAESMGMGDGIDDLYENVTDGISKINSIDRNAYSSQNEYVDAISDKLDEALQENGIIIEDKYVDEMAKFAADKLEGGADLTEDDIHDILFEYFAIYAGGTN